MPVSGSLSSTLMSFPTQCLVFRMGLRRLHTAPLVLLAVLIQQPCTVRSAELTVGILGPWDAPGSHVYPLLGCRTAGAVPLALDRIRAERILGNHTLTFVYRDTGCDPRRASGSAVELRLSPGGVHAFVGPPCSGPCRSVRDLAAYWGTPLVSWFCPRAPAAASGDPYQSFARTSVPFSGLSSLPGAVMAHYGFASASVVYADAPPWSSLADVVLTTMVNTGLTISSLQSYRAPLDVQNAVAILQKVKDVSHVIWLIMGGVTTLQGDEQVFMLAADQLGMTGGQRAFFRLELFPDAGHTTPWSPVLVTGNATGAREAEPNEDSLRRAYEALVLVTYRLPQDGRIEELLGQIAGRLTDPGFDLYPKINTSTPSVMSAFLYDSVLLFAHAAAQHVQANGYGATNYTRTDVTFEGMTGYVVLDSAGDRVANFSLLDLKNGERFEAVGHVTGTLPVVEAIPDAEVWWPGRAIPAEPKCGYQGEKCLDSSIIIAIIVGSLVTLVLLIIVPYISLKYRKYVIRKDWLIEIDELTFLPFQNSTLGLGLQGYPSTFRLPNVSERLLSQQSLASQAQSVQEKLRQKENQKLSPDFTLAKYKSETVGLRRAKVTNVLTLNKVTKKELKEMRWLVHDNLSRFMGVCFPTRGDSSLFYYVSEYCPKGSLKTVLANDDIKLDLSFQMSFINDLARGVQFLHNSVVKSHGLLCSNLCFIDSRWALKIAGFGSVSFHMSRDTGTTMDPEDRFSRLLWTSPELLRHELPTKGSQKGDVYSFGILIEEILTRSLPYHDSGMSSREIIRRVMTRQEPPFRPRKAASEDLSAQLSASPDGIVTRLTELMMQCWEEHPEDRPDFNIVRHRLRTMQKGRKELNLMDNMVSKMEKYTENLEQVVADRTGQLLEEKKKTDALLYRMLPQAVADELKKGQSFRGEFYDQATLYFSDIVGFTELSAMSSPMEVVDLLNDLYTCFDAILERFDVYKVETIGDAYMVASGLPSRNGSRHVSEIASMALAVRQGVQTFRIRHLPEHEVQIRIGINTGPVAAGVVGLTMPRFCLFGDTVNTASRMESHGMPQRIHLSWSTGTLLTSIGGYQLEVRGQLKIKGKGVMTTFWLLGMDEQRNGLQTQDQDSSQGNLAKKISTDTVVSEDSLLSPPTNEQQDSPRDAIVASRMPEEFPADFPSKGSSSASSLWRRREGNGNSRGDLSPRCGSDVTAETLQIFHEEGHPDTTARRGIGDVAGDVTTAPGGVNQRSCCKVHARNANPASKAEAHVSKANVLVTRPGDIASASADLVVEEGSYVRTECGDIVQSLSGGILRRPSRQHHQPRYLGSLPRDSASLPNIPPSLPNVPSLPDIRVDGGEPGTGQSDSVFSYTVPLPQLMNEITSAVTDSSGNNVELNSSN